MILIYFHLLTNRWNFKMSQCKWDQLSILPECYFQNCTCYWSPFALVLVLLTFLLQHIQHIVYIIRVYMYIRCNTDLCVFYTQTHLSTRTLSSCLPFVRLNKPSCFNHLILNSLFACVNLAALFYINFSWINYFLTLVEGINILLFICKNTFLDPDRELLTFCTDARQWN